MAETRARMKYPTKVHELLKSVFAGQPVEKKLHEVKVWQVWEDSVGSQIASKAQPVGIRDGILTVKVSSSSWMQQLSLMKPSIISQLNIMSGELLVKDIIFKAGQVSLPDKIAATKPDSRLLSKDEELWISEQATLIVDPELRETFCSLLSRHLTNSAGKS